MTRPSFHDALNAQTDKLLATLERDDVSPAAKTAARDWIHDCRSAAAAGDADRLHRLGQSVRWQLGDDGRWDFVTDMGAV